jgi:hypothetical protein
MPKTSKAFRLSDQATMALAALTRFTGSNETAIVEQALVAYARQIISPRNPTGRRRPQLASAPPESGAFVMPPCAGCR